MGFKSYFDNKVARFFLLLAILIMILPITDFIGFSRSGFDSAQIVSLRNFYIGGFISVFILISLFIYAISRKDGDDKYGRSIAFASLGEKPHLRVFGRFTYIQIVWLFYMLLLIVGLLNFNGVFGEQKTYTGVGVLEAEQFTNVDNILYSVLLVPIAENLPAMALFAFILTMLGIASRKYKWNYGVYMTLLVISFFIIGGVFGLGNHKLRYGDSDVKLQNVFFFWGVGGIVTALTGYAVPFLQTHQINNLFFDLAKTYSSDAINLSISILVLIMFLGYLFVYRGRLLGERKPTELTV